MNTTFKIRTVILLALLLIWAAGTAVRVYILSVRDRDELLRQARMLAWREAVIPARRGRILDRNGKVLAQDVFQCELVLTTRPMRQQETVYLQQELRGMFPELTIDWNQTELPLILKKDLTPAEISECTRRFRSCREIHLRGSWERWTDPEPAVRQLLGKTVRNDQQEQVGASGLEQQHDLTLSGKPGRLRVMLDRHGDWVKDTLRVIRQPANGEDLRLDRTREEILTRQEVLNEPSV